MIVWRQRYNAESPPKCRFRTREDFVLGSASRGNKRKWTLGGAYAPFKDGVEVVEVSDSEYADDTAVLFPSRAELEKWAPVLIQTFADFGMEVHIKRPGDRKEKTIVLFVAVQGCEYDRYFASEGGAATYGGTDLSDIKLPQRTKGPPSAHLPTTIQPEVRKAGRTLLRRTKAGANVALTSAIQQQDMWRYTRHLSFAMGKRTTLRCSECTMAAFPSAAGRPHNN